MGQLQVEVLGPLRVRLDGRPVPVGGPSQERVLAALVAAAGRSVSVDRLVEAVWGEEPPRTAISTLRTLVSRLRRIVGDRLVATPSGYSLGLTPDETDVGRFERLRTLALAGGGSAGSAALDEALGLWRGEAFEGHGSIPVVVAEARRLE